MYIYIYFVSGQILYSLEPLENNTFQLTTQVNILHMYTSPCDLSGRFFFPSKSRSSNVKVHHLTND